MRRHSSCRWCSGHGRSTPVGNCQDCGAPFCRKHGSWLEDRWVCSWCQRHSDAKE